MEEKICKACKKPLKELSDIIGWKQCECGFSLEKNGILLESEIPLENYVKRE